MHAFTRKEKTQIHNASVQILENVGVVFQNEKIHTVYKRHNTRMDGQRVFINEAQIRKAMETVSDTFEISARNPEKSVIVGEGDPICVPGCGSKMIMSETGGQRKGILEDYFNFCKLVHTSHQVDMTGYKMVIPSNVDKAHIDLLMMQANIVQCDKPFIGPAAPIQSARDAIEMVNILWGEVTGIPKKHVMLSILKPDAPLSWGADMAAAMLIYAGCNQPIMFETRTMWALGEPETEAEIVAIQNAEMLSGLVTTQLINPGLPVVFGGPGAGCGGPNNRFCAGLPGWAKRISAATQMAHFYGIPGRWGSGLTDARTLDLQAGIESAAGLYAAYVSRAGFLPHACGSMGASQCMSYEKFTIDEEILAMIKRMTAPVPVSAKTIDPEVVKQATANVRDKNAPGNPFEAHGNGTAGDDLFSHPTVGQWVSNGSNGIYEQASRTVKKRLESYRRPEIDRIIEKQISRYIEKRIRG